jgi:Bardet-Biedl syndrome 5 protein
VKAKQKNSRFEFIFQTLEGDNTTLFEHLKRVVHSYESTKLYREIKARGAIAENKSLILFPQEKVINRYLNMSSLSQDNT